MHKLIEKMREQLDIEIKKANEQLTSGNLDTIYKLTSAIKNLECMEKGDCGDGMKMAKEVAAGFVDKYSNGKYDHNIDALYDAYIAAKKKYHEMGDQGHRDKLMESVGRLMTEVYDMLSGIVIDSDFKDEKNEVMKRIAKLADM